MLKKYVKIGVFCLLGLLGNSLLGTWLLDDEDVPVLEDDIEYVYPRSYSEWKQAVLQGKEISCLYFTPFRKDANFNKVISASIFVNFFAKQMQIYFDKYKSSKADISKKRCLEFFQEVNKEYTKAQSLIALITDSERKLEAEDCMGMIQEKLFECRDIQTLLTSNTSKLLRQRALTGRQPIAYRMLQDTIKK